MRVKFAPGQGFHQELKCRVDEYFQRTGCARRDRPAMYLKAAVLLAWLGGLTAFSFLGRRRGGRPCPCRSRSGWPWRVSALTSSMTGATTPFRTEPLSTG